MKRMGSVTSDMLIQAYYGTARVNLTKPQNVQAVFLGFLIECTCSITDFHLL